MRWSVSLQTVGDREIGLEEVLELADAVAAHEGIATGMGTQSYGAQMIVEADSGDEAVERAMAIFAGAVARAGLPEWPVVNVETAADEAETAWYQEIPEGRGFGGGGAG